MAKAATLGVWLGRGIRARGQLLEGTLANRDIRQEGAFADEEWRAAHQALAEASWRWAGPEQK
ncbi:hypothetical protein B9T07_26185 [Limnospira fusiformis CCALA 023]